MSVANVVLSLLAILALTLGTAVFVAAEFSLTARVRAHGAVLDEVLRLAGG